MLAERGASISNEAISRGFAAATWPGRLEKISERPEIYMDGTHNPAGAREIVAFWDQFLAGRNIILIYGAMRDKAVDEIAGLLFPRASAVILTAPAQSRSISAPLLAEMTAHHARRAEVLPDPAQALSRALELASPDDVIFITGSLYLVGELRREWMSRKGSQPASL
jgi:dihydrofolate synthase/folylpolyglutamate synthase